jgi:CRISPR-associated protein Cmr1
VRGLGGYACDPTSENRCPDKNGNRCAACDLFGCTGWARKFRLKVSDGKKLLDGQNILIPSGRIHQPKKGARAGGWFVFSDSRISEIDFELVPLRDVDLEPVQTILTLISRHASIGSKGSNGYGVIHAQGIQPGLTWLKAFSNSSILRTQYLHDFRDFFFARFQFAEPACNGSWWQDVYGIRQATSGKLANSSSPPPLRKSRNELEQMIHHGILPLAPVIRNWLHYIWKHGLNRDQEQYIFCDARAAIGSKILTSYAYRVDGRWEFRIWGWLPCAGEIKIRDKFLQMLKDQLLGDALWQHVFGNTGIKPELTEWHALPCDQTNGRAYL